MLAAARELVADGRLIVVVGCGGEGGPARVHVDADRRAAIAHALGLAGAGDVVVIAGKGHEQGQERNGTITPFDDRAVARDILEGAT